jgi:hypothetical protein
VVIRTKGYQATSVSDILNTANIGTDILDEMINQSK